MTDGVTVAAVFAKTILALAPYAEDIVFIGGWVHALYLAEANEAAHALFTDDIDVTIPPFLLTAGRPTLLALAEGAGFDIEKERDDAPIEVVQYASDNSAIYLDILTEHPNPREPVKIEGQPDLLAQGYPGQQQPSDDGWLGNSSVALAASADSCPDALRLRVAQRTVVKDPRATRQGG